MLSLSPCSPCAIAIADCTFKSDSSTASLPPPNAPIAPCAKENPLATPVSAPPTFCARFWLIPSKVKSVSMITFFILPTCPEISVNSLEAVSPAAAIAYSLSSNSPIVVLKGIAPSPFASSKLPPNSSKLFIADLALTSISMVFLIAMISLV